ncbi:MAG: hypothetical protein AABZ77_05805 [Chloroflexota bacterium]
MVTKTDAYPDVAIRLGSIRLKHEWDTVILILMDIDFEPIKIYEALRADIERELKNQVLKQETKGAH